MKNILKISTAALLVVLSFSHNSVQASVTETEGEKLDAPKKIRLIPPFKDADSKKEARNTIAKLIVTPENPEKQYIGASAWFLLWEGHPFEKALAAVALQGIANEECHPKRAAARRDLGIYKPVTPPEEMKPVNPNPPYLMDIALRLSVSQDLDDQQLALNVAIRLLYAHGEAWVRDKFKTYKEAQITRLVGMLEEKGEIPKL
ncbi:hypothetical protein [Candidatus Nucleicultrix amoebiphila]|uniref:Uncharacterized protein n=1 Tax=Candidatus Nucleicultrix amoebiphila FS5 TaxID=1414854 RepID=A0A1W6N543_9PROT|nr:hypothetical protein [Candidatus Nucleicultrix amoebiphila]ARN84942.1 hypothetical protein GQ61_06200 [Candidatus Nucleicultrix amoebiphila FS5]